jgi:hypothetical protein
VGRNYGSLQKHLLAVKHKALFIAAREQHDPDWKTEFHGTLKRGSDASGTSGSTSKRTKKSSSTQSNKITSMFVAKKSPQEVAKEKEILSMAALDAHVKFWAETFSPLHCMERNSFTELLDTVAECGRKGAAYKFTKHKINERATMLAHIGREKIKRRHFKVRFFQQQQIIGPVAVDTHMRHSLYSTSKTFKNKIGFLQCINSMVQQHTSKL